MTSLLYFAFSTAHSLKASFILYMMKSLIGCQTGWSFFTNLIGNKSVLQHMKSCFVSKRFVYRVRCSPIIEATAIPSHQTRNTAKNLI